jgi:hypothetical protein
MLCHQLRQNLVFSQSGSSSLKRSAPDRIAGRNVQRTHDSATSGSCALRPSSPERRPAAYRWPEICDAVRGEVVIDERHGRNYSAGGQRSVIAVLNRY